MIVDSRKVTCGRARLCVVYGAEAEASEQGDLKALMNFLADKKEMLMPEAAGVWHSEVYGAMLDTEAAGGYMNC